MTPVLRVEGAVKRFGGLLAVNDVSFDVAEREVLGIIGPNGSGKSTMINLISGALPPTGGTISLRGAVISGRPAHAIARMGVARTFQLVRLLPALTVIENVMAGAVFGHRRRWGAAAERQAVAQLAEVGLGQAAALPLSALTYIDTKRVELARALAAEPEVLLLDEWLAGLSPAELAGGIALIKRLQAGGRTIVLVEHVMDAIRSLCDRCIVLAAGAKIAEGTPAAVLADPAVIRAYLGDGDA